MTKTLVAFFSATGTTKHVAKELAQVIGSDAYEIKPAFPYTEEDLDWTNKKSRSSIEMNDLSNRPALADKDAKIERYDTILVGFPIWWGVAPRIINTFLESYDFAGKKMALFATSGGSGLGHTAALLKSSVAADTDIVAEKLLNGRQTEDRLKAWAKTILKDV